MKARYCLSRQILLSIGILLLVISAPASDFFYGAWNDYHYAQSGEHKFADSLYATLGFNGFVGLVADSGTAIYGIDVFADRGWHVIAANAFKDYDDSGFVTSWIYKAGKEAHSIHWEAEHLDTVDLWADGRSTLIEHHTGSAQGAYWTADPASDTAGPFWELNYLRRQYGPGVVGSIAGRRRIRGARHKGLRRNR